MKYCDPRLDVTFKKVFGQNKELLLSFLNALLPLEGDHVIESIEYLTPEMIPEIKEAKYSVVDVQCQDKAGRKFLVEMQMVWSEEFKSRVLFNASKAYASQLMIGDNYKLLQPVYSLNIVNDIFETDLPDDEYYHYYQLVHSRHTEKVIEGLHIAFVELPKFKPETEKGKEMLNLWLRFMTEVNERTRVVAEELMANPLIHQAVTLMEVAAMTDRERYAYEKNIDNIRVERAIMRTTKEKGLAEGRAEGRAEGIAEGRAEGEKIGIAKGKEIGIAEGFEQGRAAEREMLADRMREAGIDPSTIDRIIQL